MRARNVAAVELSAAAGGVPLRDRMAVEVEEGEVLDGASMVVAVGISEGQRQQRSVLWAESALWRAVQVPRTEAGDPDSEISRGKKLRIAARAVRGMETLCTRLYRHTKGSPAETDRQSQQSASQMTFVEMDVGRHRVGESMLIGAVSPP